MHRINQ